MSHYVFIISILIIIMLLLFILIYICVMAMHYNKQISKNTLVLNVLLAVQTVFEKVDTFKNSENQ